MLVRCVVLLYCGLATTLLGPLIVAPGYAQASVIGVPAEADAPRGNYGWPLPGWPRVARPFQPPMSTYGPGHRGVDLAAVVDSSVLAAADGTVVFAGELAGRGVISVQHPDGLRTTYEPVGALVAQGAAVARGQLLGVLAPGHPGCSAAACLHWGVRRAKVYLDPLRLIGHWQVRLKPWSA